MAENVHGAHVVVISSAVGHNNVEVVEAERLKIPVIPRAEMLAELMRLKYGIAVAGAHGKTTTTSLIASVLAAAGLDPTFVVGGRVNHIGSNARVGLGEYMVVEADESDRSFLMLAPVIAVITTIDREHLDQYSSLEEIQDTFLQFANHVPFYGDVILCLDEPNVQAILPRVKRPVITLRHIEPGGPDYQRRENERPFERFPSEISRRRSGHVPLAVASGNSQCAQRRSRSGRGAGAERSRGLDSRRPCEICRSRPPVRNQGNLRRRDVD